MNPLASKLLQITVEYIGPASQRFLERQTEKHLNGLKFEMIEKHHLTELSKWINVSASLLIDASKASELAHKIAAA